MALNLKNAEVERLAEEIAAMTGESKTWCSSTPADLPDVDWKV